MLVELDFRLRQVEIDRATLVALLAVMIASEVALALGRVRDWSLVALPQAADAPQAGIAAAVGISRAHVALEMKRLMGKRLVEGLHAHIDDNGIRRKVYRAIDERRHAVYTPEGERMPLVRGVTREIPVVILRCPSCGKESRVALED